MNKDNGGTAFPCNEANLGQGGAYEPDPGMSLRDYFAAKAMQGLVEGSAYSQKAFIASWAYEIADVMLAERAKTPKNLST